MPARKIGRLVIISVAMATAVRDGRGDDVVCHGCGRTSQADIAVADAFGALFNSQLMANILIAVVLPVF